ncbi:MAG TPA: FtsK/SpoIIIE domain-containing protein [Aggregatilineales bacterium]|nr:hypothetical protein [Anaerolineales bacterium]HRE46272.1 FtsK/SpoIIIE domain-containing protein [Aggregatilineales bacterium]
MPKYISRPPRIQPELPVGEVQIPNPPQREQGGQNLLTMIVPMITIFGYVMVSGGRGGSSFLFVLPMVLSVGATTGLSLYQFFQARKLQGVRDEIYRRRLLELRKQMQEMHDRQRAFYTHNYLDTEAVLRLVNGVDGSTPDTRLWERRPYDNDFGHVRVGIGSIPSTFILKPPQADNADSPLVFDAIKLGEDSMIVRDVPIAIPLRPRVGETPEDDEAIRLGERLKAPGRYAFGIAGEKGKTSDFVRAVLTHFTAFHSPNDARLYLIGSEDRKTDWDWARWLPHCNTSRDEAGRGDLMAFEQRKARRLWADLQGELERRQQRLGDENAGDVTLPFILVIVDALNPEAKDAPLNVVSTEAAASILMTQGPQLGAAIVFIVPSRDQVPSECRSIVEVNDVEGRSVFRYAEVGLNTLRADGDSDHIDAKRAESDYARKLAPLVIRTTYGADLANALSLLELMTLFEKEKAPNSTTIYDDVNKFPILEWWRRSRESEASEWMVAPIGLLGGNKVRSLIFEAQADGVHGLVAGTTGSGKSEMLLTVIVGLALRYDPSVINFVLADYKGGAAFDPFRPLPHAVDVVTSLQGSLGARTFVATKAEMNRRSAILAETKAKHIVEYRKRNLHVSREPFPFLFIIVDEFAEMIKENPEFKGNLDSITRLGRALGVTLILATQRPAGVITDQMRSNIKWRVCLRVETAEDSRELLKRSDAAFLPNNIPGRAYLQVGNDNVELMQVARAGGPYLGPQVDTEPPVIWFNRESSRKDKQDRGPSVEAKALSDVLVELMHQIADENDDIVPQKKPWPDPLPTRLSLTQERLPTDVEPSLFLPLSPAVIDWVEGEGSWNGVDWEKRAMRATVGIVDNPGNAEQFALTVDLARGHAIIFGASGWGKTVFVRTVVTALAAIQSPRELHVYMLDFGGKGLDILTDLPQVAACIQPSEDDRVMGFIRRMTDELEQRKAILAQARTDNIYIYNVQHPEKPIPSILAIIDNFAEFKESFEPNIQDLIAITRDGRSAGIHFILTAQTIATVPSKLYNNLTERYTLKLADGDYASVVGRSQIPLSDIAGRGFVNHENQALEMQIAMPVIATREELEQGIDDGKKLSKLMMTMDAAWGNNPRPLAIDLSTALSLTELLGFQDNTVYDDVAKFPIMDWWRASRKPESSAWMRAPLGLVTGNKVRTLIFSADADGSHGMVAGTTGSGKSELLLTLVAGMALRYDPSVVNFILADYKGGTAFDPFKGLPHAVDIITNLQGTAGARTFTAMRAEMNRRSVMLAGAGCKHIVEFRKKNFHVTREPFPFLFVIVDEFAEMVKENPEFVASLDSITRLGRALGMTLILATQRPAGVVNDQMRANIKWRVCLRVETGEDSRELLKRPDAAFLPNSIPGRAYLQVGNDNIELMQVARAGGPYLGPLPQFMRETVGEEGETSTKTRSAENAPALSDLLTLMMKRLQEEHSDEVPKQIKPYPDPLPARFALNDPEIPHQSMDNPLLPLVPSLNDWWEGRGEWKGINWLDDAMRCRVGLVDHPMQARQLPLLFDFQRGHAAIFGASGWGKTILMRSIVTALCATHSPQELNVYMMDFGGKGLDVLTDLPHVASSVAPSEDDRVTALLRRLNDEMDVRKTILSQARADNIYRYNSQNPDKAIPSILVVIDNFAEFKENYEPLMADLTSIIRDARSNGIHFIITGQQAGVIPNKLFNQLTERMTFKLADVGEYGMVVGRAAMQLPDLPGRGYVALENTPLEMHVALPMIVTTEESQAGLDDTKKLSKLILKMRDAWGSKPRPLSIDLVKALSLSELFALLYNTTFDTVDKFPIEDWWRESTIPKNADWMVAPIGLVTGNKVRSLKFEANADGSHGMVAGTTGSGKSELLLTLVAGMAMRYDPSVVNFILADYKGGTAFDPFKKLPHAVDIITNLQGTAGARTFTAMRAEMNRRSVMLAEKRTKHIVEYRSKGFDKTHKPYPFLFVIVDEFAEMVKENPEFKASLDSITRLGRALGLSLILATQRPAGVVTDQMRSNMKWRICLRVESGEDSRELLKRPDAASLPNSIPGRGFVQVGNDNIELMQVARAGGPYRGPLPEYLKDPQYEEDFAASGGDLPLSDVLTLMMHHMQQESPEEFQKQPKPYPDPLPEILTVTQDRLVKDFAKNKLLPLLPQVIEWNEGGNGWHGINWETEAMRINIGLVDNPISAEQVHLHLNLTRGHAVIFGTSGYGKTTFLRSLITGLCATHSPAELQVYMFDFGGRGLDILTELPHVGASIQPAQDERVMRMMRKIANELDYRKQVLSEAKAENLYAYNAQNPDKAIPAMLIVCDNFAEFKESYEPQMVELISMMRDARANGLHLVITAEQTNSVPGKIYSLLTERMSLKLSDFGEYSSIVGRPIGDLPPVAGRGFIAVDRSPLEMQVAMIVKATAEERAEGLDDNKKLSALIAKLKAAWGDQPLPSKIDVLRTVIPLRSVLPAKRPARVAAHLGLMDSDLSTLTVDLAARGPHFVTLGAPLSGKTTFLRTWALSMATMYTPQEVMIILVDFSQRLFRYGGRKTMADIPHVLECVATQEAMERVVKYLQTEYMTEDRDYKTHPRPEIYMIIDNYDEFTNVFGSGITSRSTFYKDMSDITRKYGTDGFHVVLSASSGIMRQLDDFIRQALAPRLGVGLDSGESAGQLGGRVRGGGQEEFPPGRGFLVRSGKASLLQIATPQESTMTMEDALDSWVQQSIERAGGTKAAWYIHSRPDLMAAYEEQLAMMASGAQPMMPGGMISPSMRIVTPSAGSDPAEVAKLKAEQEALKAEQTVDPFAAIEGDDSNLDKYKLSEEELKAQEEAILAELKAKQEGEATGNGSASTNGDAETPQKGTRKSKAPEAGDK